MVQARYILGSRIKHICQIRYILGFFTPNTLRWIYGISLADVCNLSCAVQWTIHCSTKQAYLRYVVISPKRCATFAHNASASGQPSWLSPDFATNHHGEFSELYLVCLVSDTSFRHTWWLYLLMLSVLPPKMEFQSFNTDDRKVTRNIQHQSSSDLSYSKKTCVRALLMGFVTSACRVTVSTATNVTKAASKVLGH